MLHFFPPGMVERYALFAFLAVLGVLQLIAAHYHWVGFSLPGWRRWHWGYALGTVLVGSAYFWFFRTAQALIFEPGLAGAELFTVFAVSTFLAIAATLGLVSVLHGSPAARPELNGEQVELQPGHCTIQPAAVAGQAPAVVVVSDLPDGDFPVSRLTDELVKLGAMVLTMDLAEGGPVEYPEVLARLPAACSYLQDRSDVDSEGVVLIGAGIGGDLALRAAVADLEVRGVTAIDPVLNPETTGLELLHRSTFWETVRWGDLRRRLAEALAVAERLPRLEGRPVLLVFRANPPPVAEITDGHAEVAVVHAYDEAIRRVVEWSTEVMAGWGYVA